MTSTHGKMVAYLLASIAASLLAQNSIDTTIGTVLRVLAALYFALAILSGVFEWVREVW